MKPKRGAPSLRDNVKMVLTLHGWMSVGEIQKIFGRHYTEKAIEKALRTLKVEWRTRDEINQYRVGEK